MLPESSAALPVSVLNALAKNLLEKELSGLWITGEVSNLTRAASGHMYFALKDQHAQVRCALFRGNRSPLAAALKDGDEVELSGNITLYEARGEFQIVVGQIRHTGAGRLYAAYEALKKKLAAEGVFDETRKKKLPEYPQIIGIVTSPAAAALRDVVTTLRRRNPNIRLILYPAAVQGKDCGQQIAAAIQTANIRNEADLLIVCRGGGSIEDLWGFNEEITVRAIAASVLPVINAVGHETDFTLSDFAADKRAPTPTAAAEIAAPALDTLAEKLNTAAADFHEKFRRCCIDAAQKLDYAAQKLQHPREKITAMRENLHNRQILLEERITQKLTLTRQKVGAQEQLLQTVRPTTAAWTEKIERYAQIYAQYRQTIVKERCLKVAQAEALLDAVSPQNILDRGYSVVSDTRGKVVKSNEKLKLGQKIHIRFASGTADALIAQENKQMDLFD